jgi:hypothetical protein
VVIIHLVVFFFSFASISYEIIGMNVNTPIMVRLVRIKLGYGPTNRPISMRMNTQGKAISIVNKKKVTRAKNP